MSEKRCLKADRGMRRGAKKTGGGREKGAANPRTHHDVSGRYVHMPTCGGCVWQSPNGLYCTWPCCEKGERGSG